MTVKTTEKEWFLDDISREEFHKLSGEERLNILVENELKEYSGEELKAKVEEIKRITARFVKEQRLARLKRA